MGRTGSSCKLKISSLFELWIPPSKVMKKYYEFEFMQALFTENSRSHKLQNTLWGTFMNLHCWCQTSMILCNQTQYLSLLHACATSGFNIFPSATCPTDQNLSHLAHQVNSSKSHQLPQCSNNLTGQGELAPTLIPSPFWVKPLSGHSKPQKMLD
jgi:hypothetical protein